MTSNQENKPSSMLAGYQWPILLTLGVTLLLGAIGGGFYLYVLDREHYYNDRYFRQLNSQAEDVSRRLENYRDVIYSAGRTGLNGRVEHKGNKVRYVILPRVIDAANDAPVSLANLFREVQSTKCLKAPLDYELADIIGTQLCQISDFSNVDVFSLPFPSGLPPSSIEDSQVAKGKDGKETKKGAPLSAQRGAGIYWIGKCLSGKKAYSAARLMSKAIPFFGVDTQWRSSNSIFIVQALVPSLRVEGDKCLPARWQITAEVDGKNLFRKAFIDRSFDDLLLVDRNGKVLFQTGESELQFTRVDLLLSGGGGVSGLESELAKSSPVGQSTGKEVVGLEVRSQVEGKDDASLLRKVPTRQEVSVGGKSMYVFALPLNLPVIGKEQETFEGNPEERRSLILLGLVSKDKFRNETWQLSPSVLLLLILAALLTLLALPLLKLISMGSQDQWSLRDLTLVAGTGIIGIGVLTLALVDAGAFHWTKDQVDDELNEFASSMVQHTHEELKSAIVQLDTFDKLRAAKLKVHEQEELKYFINYFKDASPPKEKTCHEKKEEAGLPSAMLNVLHMKEFAPNGPSYKPFDSVFWVDCAGRLVAQWDARTKEDYFPPIVTSLSDRSYFADVINRRYWRMQDVDSPFALEPIFSRIDGSNNAVISIRSRIGSSDISDNAVVAALESRFLSLFDPIVPPGLGYAVVDGSNGKVLFHSQGQRNLREKFFEETDNNKKLKALITSRAQGCEDGIYGGHSHRFCVRAFKDIPWVFVMFKNMNPLRTANLEAVTVASVLYVIYTLAVLLVLIAGLTICRVGHKNFPVWLWPSKERRVQYVASALVTLGLLLVGSLSLLLFPPQPAFVVGVIILPTVGVLVTFALFKWPKTLETLPAGRVRDRITSLGKIVGYRRAYVMVCGTMLALCSVLPAAVCMTLSYESEQTFLLKAGALNLAKNFAKSADLIKERYQYHNDKTLITDRLYGNDPKPVDSKIRPWCPRRFDNSGRRDVHFASSEGTWVDAIFRSSPDFIACEENGSGEGRGKLGRDKEDWFEEIYQSLRVPYNDEFTRTHGLFSKMQESDDVQWYAPDSMKMVSYRPVHDLKRLDNSKGLERWNVAFTLRPWLTRLPGIILLGFVIGGALLVCRKPGAIPGTISPFQFMVFGIAAASIVLVWPGKPLLAISVLILLLFFTWLIYMLPGFVARRVLLLDLVPPEADRGGYLKEIRESSEFSAFAEDEKKVFEEEFGVSERLCKIGKAILGDAEKKKQFQSEFKFQHTGVDSNAVALFAYDEARFHYEETWAGMSNEEKMALFHLAKSGFIHREHPGLPSLFKKGWIILSPQLRYVNESFRQFVLSRKEEVIMLQGQLVGGTWGHLVGPLGFGMVFILAGLMYTQQELFTGITALVGVLAGLVPVISKVFDLFKSQKVSSATS